jgi:tripartite-type tricarboxylate transporter receptor subunit TctC
MKHILRTASLLSTIAAALAIASSPTTVHADSAYPDKPVRLIVPFPPGGGGDKLARMLAPTLGSLLKTSVIIDNRGGANGNIALQTLAKSPADGYTLGLTLTDHIALSPSLYDKLPYDPVKDFAPIGLVVTTPYVFTVDAKDGPADLPSVIAKAKKDAGSMSVGYPTISPLLATELLQKQSGAKFNMIPYRGIAQGLPDMLGGRLNIWVGTSVTMRGFIDGGKVRGIAVTSAKRSPALPTVPTIAESGFPGFELVTWYGIIAPAGTPAAIVEKLNAALNEVLRTPDVKAKLEEDGATIVGGPPSQFTHALTSDMARLGPMIKAAGIKAE